MNKTGNADTTEKLCKMKMEFKPIKNGTQFKKSIFTNSLTKHGLYWTWNYNFGSVMNKDLIQPVKSIQIGFPITSLLELELIQIPDLIGIRSGWTSSRP